MKQMDLKSMIDRKLTITRWEDKTKNTLEGVIKRLAEIPEDVPNVNYMNWKVNKEFDENIILEIGDERIEYNLFTFSFIQVPKGSKVEDDVSKPKNGFIIVYENKGKIRYIINKGSEALTILRRKLSYTEKNVIEKDTYPFKEDHFIWLINKIYRNRNRLEGGGSLNDLKICAIKGFKGDTNDLLTTIKAEGDSVMKTISTTCFFIESEQLEQINMDIEYKNYKNINITLNASNINSSNANSINLSADKCLSLIPNCDMCKMIIEIILSLYIEIIPIIIQNYDNDVSFESWNPEIRTEFLKQIADNVHKGVDSRIYSLIERL